MKPFLKFLFPLTILFSSITILIAQPVTWQNVYNFPESEAGRFGIQTFDGDFAILNIITGGTLAVSNLIDIDQYGKMKWKRNIDSITNSSCIQQTSDSGFIISGRNSVNRAVLIKLDRSGNLKWNRNYFQNASVINFRLIDSNNILSCGYLNSNKAFVLKTDSSGNIIWYKIIPSFLDNEADAVILNADGFIYITGSDGDNMMFAKLDNNGDIIWINTHGTTGFGDFQWGSAIVAGSNRELFISGICFKNFYSNGHFSKIDSSGNLIFQNVLPETINADYMCRTSNGLFAVTSEGGTAFQEIQFLLINSNGDILTRKLYSAFGFYTENSNSIVETADKGFLITGSVLYSPNNNFNTYDIYVIKTDSTGYAPVSVKNLSNEIPTAFELYQNYPNPFNPETKISYELRVTNYVSVIVCDVLGNEIQTLVNQKQNVGRYEVVFDGSNLPSGVYFYKLTTGSPREAGDFTDVKRMVLLK